MTIYILIRSLIENKGWVLAIKEIIVIMFVVLLLDYIRIFKIIGFEKLLKQYEEPSKRKLFIHPIIYFIISFGLLWLLKLLNLFPKEVV
jgi:succinate dehydrogenase hydrophobic anchor subunit